MNRKELQKLSIETEDGVFTPKYTYEHFDGSRYTNLVIEKTAEEVYKDYLKRKQIDICPEPTAEEKIAQLEQDKEALAENVYALAEIIEALIGGETDGQASTVTETTTD